MERVDKDQPAVGLAGLNAGLPVPITGVGSFLDLLFGEVTGLELRSGQPIEPEGDPRVFLDLEGPDNEALARATDQQRDAGVDAEDFQDLPGAREEPRGHEDQPK